MLLLKRMGFIEAIFPEGVVLNWDHPNGIMRSGQARNIASMSLAPFLRDNDPDTLATLLRRGEFPEDFVNEISLLVRLFDPTLITTESIKKARRNPGSNPTEFDTLLELKHLLKQTPQLPSSIIVRFAQHYQLPPKVPNGPLYIAAMLKYPMKRIRAGFLGTDGQPLVKDGIKATTGKLHDPVNFASDVKSAAAEGKPIYAMPQSPDVSRERPMQHEPDTTGSPTKFKKKYLPSREQMLMQRKVANPTIQKGKHWTQLPMEQLMRKAPSQGEVSRRRKDQLAATARERKWKDQETGIPIQESGGGGDTDGAS